MSVREKASKRLKLKEIAYIARAKARAYRARARAIAYRARAKVYRAIPVA